MFIPPLVNSLMVKSRIFIIMSPFWCLDEVNFRFKSENILGMLSQGVIKLHEIT